MGREGGGMGGEGRVSKGEVRADSSGRSGTGVDTEGAMDRGSGENCRSSAMPVDKTNSSHLIS